MFFIEFFKRVIKVMFGLFLYALGIYITVHANIGLAPWDAFTQGLTNVTGIPFGTMLSLSGVIILIIALFLKEKIGVATILNTIMIGVFVNILNTTNLLPMNTNFIVGIGMLLLGQTIICVGSFFYISPAMGCGPRDTLMVGLGKRLKKAPIGLVRGLIEGTVLVTGFLLGAKVGVGTIIAVFGISFLLQLVFHLLKFDIKAVKHDSLIDTYKQFKVAISKPKPTEAVTAVVSETDSESDK